MGATEQDKERAKFIATCFDDMDESFFSTMQNILTHVDFGFSVLEKVFKRRVKGNSKYDDGLIGLKGLKPRHQATLAGWEFSDDGRDLTAMLQSTERLQYSTRFTNSIPLGTDIRIPREKIMIFRTNGAYNNPEGESMLKAAYLPWRYKRFVQEQTQIGVGRDLAGLLAVKMPAAFMSADADAAKRSVYEDYKKAVRNVSMGEQGAIIIPSDKDPDTKGDLFSVDLLSSAGAKAYDTVAITQQLQSECLIALFCDILQLGSNSTGSFALADGKMTIVEAALSFRLAEIADVISSDLIPMLYKYNGWDASMAPKFVFDPVAEHSIDELGKLIQRCAATGVLEADRSVLNIIRKAIGADLYPDDEEPHEEYMNKPTTKSGQGMEEGLNGGTGKATGNSGDASTSNADNAS